MAGFLPLLRNVECCVEIEKNIDKKLANRISYQIWYKGCLKGKFGRGVHIRQQIWTDGGEGGGVQICGGSKSAVTPGRRIESCELEQLSKEILEYEAIMTTIWKKKYNSYWYVLNIRTLQETL